jgi:GT2 family glycosyltransferase
MLESFGGHIETLIVIDNGNSGWKPSTDKASNVHCWTMPSNLGVAASWNLGIKATPKSEGWMIVNHDIVFGENGVAEFFGLASRSNIVLGGKPNWSCVWIGSDVVKKVGIFHEGYHPAYFEDNDYELRARALNVPVALSMAPIFHRNSSTLQSSSQFQERNAKTFQANRELFEERVKAGNIPDKEWDLQRRLDLSWD